VATTPYTYGRFIGRVGGLAVALGIGAAIANSPAIAAADDGQSSSSEAGSSGSSATTSSKTQDESAEQKPTDKTVTTESESSEPTPSSNEALLTDLWVIDGRAGLGGALRG
jgi:hypothetical protein